MEPQPASFRILAHHSLVNGLITSFTVEDPEGVGINKRPQYTREIHSKYPSVSPQDLDEATVHYTAYRAVVVLRRDPSIALVNLADTPQSEMSTSQRLAEYGVPEEEYEQVITLDRKYTLEELRAMCRTHNLPVSGDKKKLISRLLAARAWPAANSPGSWL